MFGGIESTGHMLEKGRGAASSSKQAPLKVWEAHNKHCRMKGNASVWWEAVVL